MESSQIAVGSANSVTMDELQSFVPEEIFVITDISHAWAFSTERTKILVTGYFHEQYLHLANSYLYCVCGDACTRAETVQSGVYRCLVSPNSAGVVDLFLSLDGHKPISQVLNFEYRFPLCDPVVLSEGKPNWEEFKLQMRLAALLVYTSRSLDILTSNVSPANMKEAKKFARKTFGISNSWAFLLKLIEENRVSLAQAKDGLFELSLKNMLREWLRERVLEGCHKTGEYDAQGQGVLHLCAILGYTWAVYLFSWSGLSLDARDKHGWTALHWAAYYGREKMVAVLLSAEAKLSLVTDPTSENPEGCTAADLASRKGYDGLAAYLAEKALVAHFKDMSIAGNVSGSLQTSATDADAVNSENLSEEELHLNDTLAAYRTAADAAEHAFHNYETQKKMSAAARIQCRYRTWRMRKEFLNMGVNAIKIQVAFRGFQARRQFHKLIWSVGVLDKAILRWNFKRRGLHGLRPVEVFANGRQESDAEEDFYQATQKQAEERFKLAVSRVEVMFHSKKAQKEYRRMKLTHKQAEVGHLTDNQAEYLKGDTLVSGCRVPHSCIGQNFGSGSQSYVSFEVDGEESAAHKLFPDGRSQEYRPQFSGPTKYQNTQYADSSSSSSVGNWKNLNEDTSEEEEETEESDDATRRIFIFEPDSK